MDCKIKLFARIDKFLPSKWIKVLLSVLQGQIKSFVLKSLLNPSLLLTYFVQFFRGKYCIPYGGTMNRIDQQLNKTPV
jgi:hypothetical protein